jgi:hypothetical protein
MPWAVLKAPPITEMQVTPDNGKTYFLTFRAGEAYLPLHLFNHLLFKGVIVPGDKPAPPARFEKVGNVHGKQISPFADFVREVIS